jgi:hypothetical protein
LQKNNVMKTIIKVAVFMVVAAVALPACAEPDAGRFVANADSTVTDTSTGLMWAAKDNGSKLNLENAKSYCEDYSGGGYTDWRMPTLNELSGLFDPNENSVKGFHLSPLIRLSACCPWASETRGSRAAFLNFITGSPGWNSPRYSGYNRALPVRSNN